MQCKYTFLKYFSNFKLRILNLNETISKNFYHYFIRKYILYTIILDKINYKYINKKLK